jgi:hypothetical protein
VGFAGSPYGLLVAKQSGEGRAKLQKVSLYLNSTGSVSVEAEFRSHQARVQRNLLVSKIHELHQADSPFFDTAKYSQVPPV